MPETERARGVFLKGLAGLQDKTRKDRKKENGKMVKLFLDLMFVDVRYCVPWYFLTWTSLCRTRSKLLQERSACFHHPLQRTAKGKIQSLNRSLLCSVICFSLCVAWNRGIVRIDLTPPRTVGISTTIETRTAKRYKFLRLSVML